MKKEELAKKHGKELWGDPTLQRQREYAEHSFKKGFETLEKENTELKSFLDELIKDSEGERKLTKAYFYNRAKKLITKYLKNSLKKDAK